MNPGTNGDQDLSDPILQVQDIGNFQELDADHLSAFDPNICKNLGLGPQMYFCAVPKIGKSYEGLVSKPLVGNNDAGFAPGSCGLHVTQFQKPDPSKDNYSIAAQVKDANGVEIGSIAKTDSGSPVTVNSKLPNPVIITTEGVDADPVLMAVGADHFGSNDQEHHCNFGAYDSGKREGDCGFAC